MASTSTPSVIEPTRPYFSPHRQAKAKRPNRRKIGICHVALTSVLLGENPSEEVDDYDNYNYYYYYYELIARIDGFSRAPEIDFC